MIDLKVKKIDEKAKIPEYQSSGASGFDLHSIEDAVLKAGDFGVIKTGLAFEIPNGYEIQVRARSGLAYKNGIGVLNSPGTIDSDYRGEVMVILFNFSKEDFRIKSGDRIAQAVLSKVSIANLIVSGNLDETKRGNNGFGSTGV